MKIFMYFVLVGAQANRILSKSYFFFRKSTWKNDIIQDQDSIGTYDL